MKAICVLFTLLIAYAYSESESQGQDPNVKVDRSNGKVKIKSPKSKLSASVADDLISALQAQEWADEETPCITTALDVLAGVKNNIFWATWIWDANQPPVGAFYGSNYHMGSPDQCLHPPWTWSHPGLRTQYCLVDVRYEGVQSKRIFDVYDRADEYFETPTKHGLVLNEQTFGVCLPAVCSPSSVGKIYSQIHRLTHLPRGDVTVDPTECQTAGERKGYSMGFHVFWFTLGLLFLINLISSYINNGDFKLVSKHKNVDSIVKSFCIKSNFNGLFKTTKYDVPSLHGMKFLSAIILVFFHIAVLSGIFANNLRTVQILNSPTGLTMIHLHIVVDTFFVISGLLLVRGLMSRSQGNLLLGLCKRYLRLIGPYMFSIWLLTSVAEHMLTEPSAARIIRQQARRCENTWWRHLVMQTGVAIECYIVSWYVACDYQLAMLGTCLVYIYQRNKRYGVTAFFAVACGLTLNLGWVVYKNELVISPFYGVYSMTQITSSKVLPLAYMNMESRAGPYTIGMAMGYIMTKWKPVGYKNSISKKWSIFTTLVCTFTMCLLLRLGYIYSGEYNALQAAIVVATSRVVWAVAACCYIGVCEYGNIPLIRDFLSWPGFVPLSKLSYCLYLLHCFFVIKYISSAKSAASLDACFMAIGACGVVLFTLLASFVVYLLVEAPLINLATHWFSDRPKQLDSNGSTASHTQEIGDSKLKTL